MPSSAMATSSEPDARLTFASAEPERKKAPGPHRLWPQRQGRSICPCTRRSSCANRQTCRVASLAGVLRGGPRLREELCSTLRLSRSKAATKGSLERRLTQFVRSNPHWATKGADVAGAVIAAQDGRHTRSDPNRTPPRGIPYQAPIASFGKRCLRVGGGDVQAGICRLRVGPEAVRWTDTKPGGGDTAAACRFVKQQMYLLTEA
jgi:hypothetical protein